MRIQRFGGYAGAGCDAVDMTGSGEGLQMGGGAARSPRIAQIEESSGAYREGQWPTLAAAPADPAAPAPVVSVVMIFFNAERFLAEAIDSVFGQTYGAWELLLVDDGSADGSVRIAQGYAAAHPDRVRYLTHPHRKNRGMSASRNLGIANARGEYLAFLDADDVYLPEKLERQVGLLEMHRDVAMVYGPTQHWYSWTGRPEDQGRDQLRRLGVPPGTVVSAPRLIPRFLRLDAQTPGTCGVLVRRDAARAVGGFDDRFRGMFEDQVFLYKLCLRVPTFVDGVSLDRYRQHPDSYSRVKRSTGEYRSSGVPNRSYLVFLEWLEVYLREEKVADAEVWRALRSELRPYRNPVVFGLRVAGYHIRRAASLARGAVSR